MITSAVVCPPAPLLVPGLADRLAAHAQPLRDAIGAAMACLSTADRIILVAADPHAAHSTVLPSGTVVTADVFARSDQPTTPPVRLPGGVGRPRRAGERTTVIDLIAPLDHMTAGTVVGASLLAQAGITAPTVAIQFAPGDPTPPDALAGPTLDAADRVGLLVMADGSACHGDEAPGGNDPRSAEFDRKLVTALESGDPAALTETCTALTDAARELRAETLGALAALGALTRGQPPATAAVHYAAAPFGIGYVVATWAWA